MSPYLTQVSAVAISGGLHPVLASGSWDSCVKIWATREGGVARTPLTNLPELDSEVKAVHVSPDGRYA